MSANRQMSVDRQLMKGRRFVFDTAALVCAVLRPSSPAAHAFSRALSTGIICSSELALDQLAAILNRRALDLYMIRRHAWFCPAPYAKPQRKSSRTPQFKSLIAFAVSAEADALVTSAPIPRTRSPRRTLPILTPEEFLSSFTVV
jgi:predicted nucleic acid-binding protein